MLGIAYPADTTIFPILYALVATCIALLAVYAVGDIGRARGRFPGTTDPCSAPGTGITRVPP